MSSPGLARGSLDQTDRDIEYKYLYYIYHIIYIYTYICSDWFLMGSRIKIVRWLKHVLAL